MGVNLTSGAISKISGRKCTENDLKPVLQLILINCKQYIKGKKWVGLSDGSFFQLCLIDNDIFISNKLQQGSIVQLTKLQFNKYQLTKPFICSKGYQIFRRSVILCFDLIVIHSKCGIIGHPELLLPDNETPLVERTTPTIPDEYHANSHHVVEEPPTSKQKQDHVDSPLLNEDIDDVEEPPTSIQNPSTSTHKCSSHSPTQSKKRKLQSSDDIISGFGKDITKFMSGPCYKRLGTLEEGVSKMTRMMIEKNKEDAVGFTKLQTLEEDVGACFEKLEKLEEYFSRLTRMMMEKSKEDDMGACIEKLDKMGWGAEEPMYDTALLLFLKGADYRKLWLHLKPLEVCLAYWIDGN